MPCPDYPAKCRSPASPQRSLTPGKQDQITGPAVAMARDATRCGYCGLVYVAGPPRSIRLGYLDASMISQGGFVEDEQLIGWIGLHQLGPEYPFGPALEIAW